MIIPTLGRVVWYAPARHDSHVARDGDGRCAAIVTRVWSDRMVNLTVFDANGQPFGRTSVVLVQEGDQKPPDGDYCEWMPYQVGQAARHEALEKEKLAQKGHP